MKIECWWIDPQESNLRDLSSRGQGWFHSQSSMPNVQNVQSLKEFEEVVDIYHKQHYTGSGWYLLYRVIEE